MTGKILRLASGFALATALASTSHADVNCSAPGRTVQSAVDKANPGDTIFIFGGTCVGDVTITKDDITLSGNRMGNPCNKADPSASAGATIDGTITVDGVRAKIEFLEITGSGAGVTIINRADVRLFCNDISNNQETGVSVLRTSNAVLTDNTLSSNGQRRFNDPFVFFDCGLFAGGASAVASRGNTYKDNQYCAIEIDQQSAFRNGRFLPREPGNPADPDERDVYTEKGCNPGTGAGCFIDDFGPVAIEVFNGGLVDLRNADVNGEIEAAGLSSFRVDGDAAIQGNIHNEAGSIVRLRDRSSLGDRVVTYTGTLDCSGGSQAFFSNVRCGQTCSGAIPGTCMPKRCNDGIDNDGDGLIDLADPECFGDPTDDNESF